MKYPFDLTNNRQVIEFEEIDPYNPQNTLKGYINRRQGQLYGALYITHINEKEHPQVVYSAPKQHYPFDKDKNEWKFPEYDIIECYEKLDGTCIISYNYTDGKNWFTTYKTRLRPFLGSSKFGNFFSLWNEMLEKYHSIERMCKDVNHNYVFELFGKRNKILIDYDVPLNTNLIFMIDAKEGHIYPPKIFRVGFTPTPPSLNAEIISKEITEIGYITLQDALEANLKIDEENHIMKGKEGYVMYFIKDGKAVQMKCKPPSVLKYHWRGDAISYESVYTTVINAFENFDEPNYDDVVGLLKEEYDDSFIEKSRVRIEKMLGKVLFDKKFASTLHIDYKKHNFDINKDKVTCMRWFGKNYPKSEAKRIYRLLKQYEE